MYGRLFGWEFWLGMVDNWEWLPYHSACKGEHQLWLFNFYVSINRMKT